MDRMRRGVACLGRRLLSTAKYGTLGEYARNEAIVCIGLTEKAGRGLTVTRDVPASYLIHSVDPVVAHPSLKMLQRVCYFCLRQSTEERPLNACTEVLAMGSSECMDGAAKFCCTECALSAKGFYSVERRADWSTLHRYCSDHDLKFPLVAKRLACMVVSEQVPSNALEFLCYARLPHGIPPAWVCESQMLRQALSSGGFSQATAFLTDEWYAGVLSRLHLNSFRVEPIYGGEISLQEAASAAVLREGGVGCAVYMLPSLYNHSCDPNVNVTWVDNATAHFHTTRPVKAGAELFICYIDASMSRDKRQDFLVQSYGFACQCHRCTLGDDGDDFL